MKQTILEFIDFLKFPQQSFRSKHKVGILVLSMALMFFLNIFSLILNLGYGYFRLDYPEQLLLSYDEKFFLYSLLCVPIFEEIGFRLYLIPKRWNILLSSMFVIWELYPMVITGPEPLLKYTLIHFLVSMTVGVLLFLILDKIFPKIKYSYLFYFSALFFGSLHFNAFVYNEINFFVILYVILVIIMTSFVGILLGYIRVSIGIVYSILFHFLINFLPVMASYGKL